MNAKQILTAAARELTPKLTTRGFTRRGLKFVRRVDDGFVSLIELQSSQSSTAEKVLFVINYGVIVPALSVGNDLTKPYYTECHWGGRVAGVDGHEAWWAVHVGDSVEQVAADVTAILERDVLPALEMKQREEDLLALWMPGWAAGRAGARELLHLGTLLHRAGRRPELEQVKADLERVATSSFAIRALATLAGLDG